MTIGAKQFKYSCDTPCTYGTDKFGNLERHRAGEKCALKYTKSCPYCDIPMKNDDAVRAHLDKNNCKKKYQCKQCFEFFQTQRQLVAHEVQNDNGCN